MGVFTKTVSVYGSEFNFIKEFVRTLESADSKIKCVTDINEQYSSVENVPQIDFSIGNLYTIRLRRQLKISESTGFWHVYLINNGVQYCDPGLKMSSGALDYYQAASRCFNIKILSNDDSIAIWFGDYNQTNITQNYKLNVISTNMNNGGIFAFSTSTTTLAVKSTFYDKNGVGFSAFDRLNYRLDDKVEVIKGKSFLSGTTKKFEVKSLYDCSYLPLHSMVTVDEKNYYAIGNNTIMPVN